MTGLAEALGALDWHHPDDAWPPELPDGAQALEAVTVVKYLDADGEVALKLAATSGLRTWEALGMAITLADELRAGLRDDDG